MRSRRRKPLFKKAWAYSLSNSGGIGNVVNRLIEMLNKEIVPRQYHPVVYVMLTGLFALVLILGIGGQL